MLSGRCKIDCLPIAMATKKKQPSIVLIVEDERPLSRVLELKLSSAGYGVETAFDGQEALDKVKSTAYDLILLDLVMPNVDGFTVLETMKDEGIAIPVIVTSNLSQDEDIKKAEDLGARDFFVKSNTPLNELLEKVEKALMS